MSTQYRMRPSISAFPNQDFYHSALEDSPLVSTRRPPPLSQYFPSTSPPTSTVFLSHSFPESPYHQSTRNLQELDIVVSIVGDLLQKNPTLEADSIGIISPYVAQTKLLEDVFRYHASNRLRGVLGPIRSEEVSRVEVNTVDGFQGREKDIIIFSTVRSNKYGGIGFLTDKRRLNVALTRAKDALFVVGNAQTLKAATMSIWKQADPEADSDVWRRYLGWMDDRGWVREWEGKDFLGERGSYGPTSPTSSSRY